MWVIHIINIIYPRIIIKNRLFHIWWYEKNSKDLNDKTVDSQFYNIHHIDGNHLNNNFWNLIKIENSRLYLTNELNQ